MKIVDGTPYLQEVKELIIEYTESLHMDLSFQHLTDELDHLERRYVYPYGRIKVAFADDGTLAGCVCYHRYDDRRCEMKRLYVKPCYRGLQLGRILAKAIIDQARSDGYEEMVLDTFEPTMKEAVSLYTSLGFTRIEPYYHNPMAGAIYLGKSLVHGQSHGLAKNG